jgi:tRNA A37 threonylcarbamoyladenosine biosynthesis protein TsaE
MVPPEIWYTVSNLHICVGIHYTLYTIHYNRDALDVGMQCRVVHCAVHCAEWCSAVHSAVH